MGDEGGVEPEGNEAVSQSRDLPIANDFSPGSPVGNPISLPIVLKLVTENSGPDRRRRRLFARTTSPMRRPPERTPRLGWPSSSKSREMSSSAWRAYGIYDEGVAKLTPFGEQLLASSD